MYFFSLERYQRTKIMSLRGTQSICFSTPVCIMPNSVVKTCASNCKKITLLLQKKYIENRYKTRDNNDPFDDSRRPPSPPPPRCSTVEPPLQLVPRIVLRLAAHRHRPKAPLVPQRCLLHALCRRVQLGGPRSHRGLRNPPDLHPDPTGGIRRRRRGGLVGAPPGGPPLLLVPLVVPSDVSQRQRPEAPLVRQRRLLHALLRGVEEGWLVLRPE